MSLLHQWFILFDESKAFNVRAYCTISIMCNRHGHYRPRTQATLPALPVCQPRPAIYFSLPWGQLDTGCELLRHSGGRFTHTAQCKAPSRVSQKFSNQVVVVCASIPDITPIMSSLRLMVTSQSLGFSLRPEAGHYERRVSGETRRNVGSEAGYCLASGWWRRCRADGDLTP